MVFTSKVFWSHRDSVLSITFPHNDSLSLSLSIVFQVVRSVVIVPFFHECLTVTEIPWLQAWRCSPCTVCKKTKMIIWTPWEKMFSLHDFSTIFIISHPFIWYCTTVWFQFSLISVSFHSGFSFYSLVFIVWLVFLVFNVWMVCLRGKIKGNQAR